jgi:predicted transcriptional regulator
MGKHAVISARVDADLLSELDRVAAAHRRSRAWLVGEAVRRFTAEEAELLAMIEEGERSLREEPTVSADDMRQWIADKRMEIAARRQDAAA